MSFTVGVVCGRCSNAHATLQRGGCSPHLDYIYWAPADKGGSGGGGVETDLV